MKVFITLITIVFLSLAQDDSISFDLVINKANTAMSQALASYESHYPDKPLWAEAINWARTAFEMEPDNPKSLKTLARTYSYVRWYGRAYELWDSYLQHGYSLESLDKELFTQTASKQAYARYVQGSFTESKKIYEKIIQYTGYDKNAYLWAARIGLEQNQSEQPIQYLQSILSKEDDEPAKYLLSQAFELKREQDKAQYQYRAGLEELQRGEFYQAKLRFLKLIGQNSDNDLAWAALAKASFLQKYYLDAFVFYEKASSLKPENSEYRLRMIEAQRLVPSD